MIEKLKKLSNTIVNYSLDVKENDRILITVNEIDKTSQLLKYLIKDITKNKAIPFVRIIDNEINSLLLETTSDNRIKEIKKHSKQDIENYDTFISIKCSTNDFESSEIDETLRKKIKIATKEEDKIRINERKWVLLNYPSKLDAFKANMKTDKFIEFSLDTMIIDYSKMYKDIKPLKELMDKTKKVRIIGPNTDVSFSIENIDSIPCCGKYNIPDGEIYTSPVKNSVNGIITYNTKSPYNGYIFENVSLKFKDGKIIKATSSSNNEKLNEIFNIDEGARYIGEFAIGLNPKIKYPMQDILFDEKIIGSIHFTPGQAYNDAYNGNDSSLHWDLVLIQRKEYGGGEIYFDDKLIRKDGLFVLPELKHLNYENN